MERRKRSTTAGIKNRYVAGKNGPEWTKTVPFVPKIVHPGPKFVPFVPKFGPNGLNSHSFSGENADFPQLAVSRGLKGANFATPVRRSARGWIAASRGPDFKRTPAAKPLCILEGRGI